MNSKYYSAIPSSKSEQGFTLIELLVVVVITAILAAVAIPSYRNYVIKSNRSAAESFMLSIANKQEQYLLDARTYATTLNGLGLSIPADVAKNYSFSIAASNPTSAPPAYSITATPAAAQNDTQCGVIATDQTGNKGGLCAADANGNVTYTGAAMNCTAPSTTCW